MMLLMDRIKRLDPNIDYIGQEYSLKLMYSILTVGYLLSLVTGLIVKDLTYTLVLGIGTVVFCFIATVPGWPYFRTKKVIFKKKNKLE